MRAVAVIPARYASTRLPGKPIREEVRRATGKYLVQHVYERAAAARLVDRTIVATDDERIARAVRAFGGECRMTRPDHASGTDRIAEVAADLPDADLVVNVQGDEPQVRPEQVDQVLRLLLDDPEAQMGTLAHAIGNEAEFLDPNVVKVVVDARGHALYFSRSPVPCFRGHAGLPREPMLRPLHHLGIYSYRRAFLLGYAALPHSPLEQAEKLEQLRALAAGHPIAVGITAHRGIGIDTAEDLRDWLEQWRHEHATETP